MLGKLEKIEGNMFLINSEIKGMKDGTPNSEKIESEKSTEFSLI